MVRLDYNPTTDRYELVDKEKQLTALAEATRRTEPVRKSHAEQKAGEAHRRNQQTMPHLQQEVEGAEARQLREERAAQRAQARAAAAAAAGAPLRQGDPGWIENFMAEMRFDPAAAAAGCIILYNHTVISDQVM